ncbi:membrane-spanning 4-domains subfamily A member 4D-like isoform X2 [Suricata suricatta]|uniref:membrane-spanning 4-domains subfamily A member 4D-like isoform X2 n=1 Tax=Suricata suricatta TaxID=37032 RepID=UPI0011564FC5|nr:membrane-spanning 4-domains subfamily A member 4D-like isoform X2 [Suricata suricatta]
MDFQQRYPATYLGQLGPMPLPREASNNLQNFLKGEPVILGEYKPFIETTGLNIIFLLGPIFLIISGTVSIASGKKTTKKMISGSLGTNTGAAILAGVSLITLAIRIEVYRYFLSETPLVCYFIIGLMIMKLVLIILGLIISVLLSAFGCSVVCCDVTSVVVDLSSNERGLAVASFHHEYDDVAFQPA